MLLMRSYIVTQPVLWSCRWHHISYRCCRVPHCIRAQSTTTAITHPNNCPTILRPHCCLIDLIAPSPGCPLQPAECTHPVETESLSTSLQAHAPAAEPGLNTAAAATVTWIVFFSAAFVLRANYMVEISTLCGALSSTDG